MLTINWINGQAGGTPLSAENLNLMQQYIENYIDSEVARISEKAEKNIITAYNTAGQTVTDETTINLVGQIKTGTKLALRNNKIVIGEGVSKVQISASIFFEGFTHGLGYLYPSIDLNNNRVARGLEPKGVAGSTDFQTLSITPFMCAVSEGDEISLNSGDIGNESVIVRGSSSVLYTYITVEVIE